MAERLRGNPGGARSALDALQTLDPLSHFVRFEQMLSRPDEAAAKAFVAGIRGEMPQETILELAVWYYGLGRLEEAARLLEPWPAHNESGYWLAFVRHRLGDSRAAETLALAGATSPRMVFPFRPESADVFRWAASATSNWHPRYYLALLEWSWGNDARARALLDECGMRPDFAPFYAARARAFRATAPDRSLADLKRAALLEPGEWRYGKLLAERFIEDRAYAQALEVASRYAAAAPANYMLGLLHAKTLLLAGQYQATAELLGRLNVLPYEGATDARALYREAHLMLAVGELREGRFETALNRVATARLWPENLGAGKPYPDAVDERLEDWLAAKCLERLGRASEARDLLGRLASAGATRGGTGRLVSALALRQIGRQADAARALAAWSAEQGDTRVAGWGRRVWSGGRVSLPPDAASNEELRILSRLSAS